MVERRQGPRYEVPALYLRCVGLMLRGVPHVFFPAEPQRSRSAFKWLGGCSLIDQHSDSEYNTGIGKHLKRSV